jgi:hypothetical protein
MKQGEKGKGGRGEREKQGREAIVTGQEKAAQVLPFTLYPLYLFPPARFFTLPIVRIMRT